MKQLLLILLFISLHGCKSETNHAKQISQKNVVKVDVIVPEHGMADPHAWVQNDTVYVICGHDKSWNPKSSFPMDRWEVWSSSDLKNWQFHRNILPSQTYIGDKPNCWAGDICERDGKYYWFFSNRNIDTGVMVANKITGPYKDLLGRPLLPKGIVPVHPYDPEIFIEEDVYTICFGAGTYYMATLEKDMKSLSAEPKPVLVLNKNGEKMGVGDKSTLFKRNGWYYLVWGAKYAMSKNLYGPYNFKGPFLNGGHTSFFDWKGQKYVLQENHDISAFYRGASLKPVNFNADGTIIIPKDDKWYPEPGRPFEFKSSTMGWKALSGTSLTFDDGKIKGILNDRNAIIRSAPWLYTDTKLCSEIEVKIKNSTDSEELKLAIYSRQEKTKDFWSINTQPIDWTKKQWVSIPISKNDSEFKTYTIKLSEFSEVKNRLMQGALQPASNTSKGFWEIDEVIIK